MPGTVDALFYQERSTGGRRGLKGSKLIAGTVGCVLFVVTCSALGESWSWEDVISITTTQVEKIERTVSQSTKDGFQE